LKTVKDAANVESDGETSHLKEMETEYKTKEKKIGGELQ